MSCSFNVTQLKQVLPLLMKSNAVPFIWGRSGIGKTEVVRQFCKEIGYELVYLTFGAVEDVGDIIGLPNFTEVDGTEFTRHAAPSWFPTTGKKIVFIDEFNRAKPQIQQAMFPFVLEQRLHTHQLPPDCHIVVAGNPPTDDYDTTPMEDNALLSRFCHIEFEPSVDEWAIYMKQKKRDGDLVSFFLENKDLLDPKAKGFDVRTMIKHDRRNIEKLAVFMEYCTDIDMIIKAACGFLGPDIGIKFYAHLKNRREQITVEEILDKYTEVAREKVQRNFDKHDMLHKAANDVYTSIVAMFPDTEKDKKVPEKQVKNLVKFLYDLPCDIAYIYIMKLSSLDREELYNPIGNDKDLIQKFTDSKVDLSKISLTETAETKGA